MRKTMSRLFMAVLMVALLVGASIISVSAAGEPTCPGHGEGWKELKANTTITESGNYYLKESLTSGCITITNGAEVTLCLSGKNIETSDWAAVFVDKGTLNLVNCSSEGGTIKTSAAKDAYSVIAQGGSTVNIGENIHLDGSACHALWIQGYATVNMYGGTISGGKSDYNGAGVYLSSGEFNMYEGASITDCTANLGGGVYVAGGTFNMEGGTISNCKVLDGQSGGGVYVAGGTFNMKNGTITGCSGKYGGGVRNNGTFNMTGGTIGENISTDTGNGSEVYANGTTNIHGGTINGTTGTTTIHVTITKDGTKTTMDGGNLVGGLWADAAAVYEITGGKFTQTPAKYVDQTNCRLLSLTEDADGYLFEVVKYGDHDTHENWIEIGAGGMSITTPGKYVLTNKVTGSFNVSANVTGVVVCMDGKNASATDVNVIRLNDGAEITVCNCQSGTGGEISVPSKSDSITWTPRAVYATGGSTLTLGQGVKVTGCGTDVPVFMNASNFILDGGEVSGNSCTGFPAIRGYNGSNITIKAGKIENNGTSLPKAIAVEGSGTFTMTGGSISTTVSGAASGSAVHTIGTATISGGTISGKGNAVYCSSGTMTINGTVEITGDVVSNTGATVNVSENATITGSASGYGYLNISGGTITGDVTAHGATEGVDVAISGGKIGGKLTEGTEKVDTDGDGVKETTQDKVSTFVITSGQFSNKTARDALAGYAGTKVVAEIEDGAYSYKVQDTGFYSSGEYMDFHSALGLGLYLNESAENYTVSAGKYSCTSTKHGNLDVILASGIAAKDMDEAITFEVKDDDTVLFRKTMSIYEAAKTWNADANKQTMVADMINYGNEAKKVFVDDYVLMDTTDLTGATETAPDWTGDGAANAGVSDGKAELVAATLNLKDRIELNIYVRDEDATTDNGDAEKATVQNAKGETITRFTFKEIPVNAVKDTKISLNVTLADKATKFTVNYSIADYVNQALDDENNNQRELLIALQKYVDAVIEYNPGTVTE